MKFKTLSLMAGMMFVAGVALVGCGKDNNQQAQQCPQGQSWVNNQCVANYNGYNTGYNNGYNNQQQCSQGLVSTQYGCLNQVTNGQCGQAPAGQAYAIANNTCVLGTVSTGYNNGGYNNNGQCGQNAIMTQYNCLPLNPQVCGYNAGYMNGQCIPAFQGGYNNGGYNGGYYYPTYYYGNGAYFYWHF